ncbi:hypothetical protein LC612_23840 [Nostoc sp. CHAB 5834]|nr:hypothetical protein [Nostoc sp. CHAB 5834]
MAVATKIMAKIDVTISDDLKKLLEELASDSGQSLSSMAADCLKTGAYAEAERRNKVEVFRKTRKQRIENESKDKE